MPVLCFPRECVESRSNVEQKPLFGLTRVVKRQLATLDRLVGECLRTHLASQHFIAALN